jgi:nitrite reductase/ring-hydroxylating ferredoxin subunit
MKLYYGTMGKWIKVDVQVPNVDFIKGIQVGQKALCLVRHQGELFATENRCPHAGGILSGGWCENGNLVCPVHRYQYSLKNGRGAEGQGDYVYTYPVEERADGLYVQIKESWFTRLFN